MHHLLKTVRHNEMYGELLEVVWVQFSIFKLSYMYTPMVENSAKCLSSSSLLMSESRDIKK